jgi:hypothetical protein
VLNGKDILSLGWPEGKVIGLGLQTARVLESRGLSREDVLAELEDIRQDPGGALERESEAPVAELAREWVSIEAAEASASEDELRAEPLPYHTLGGGLRGRCRQAPDGDGTQATCRGRRRPYG